MKQKRGIGIPETLHYQTKIIADPDSVILYS